MDWIRFLDDNNVPFVTTSKNTKRGEISIQCPYCGEQDPSMHLGINLVNGKWGCHRDASHRGTSASRLVRAILGYSTSQSDRIVSQYNHADPDDLDKALISLESKDELYPGKTEVTEKGLKSQFAKFHKIKPRGVGRRFFQYLLNRGYGNPQKLCMDYDLRCATVGRYADRIIIPVYHNQELLGWTSRAIIDPIKAPRYLASSGDIKATVLNYDKLKEGGKRLFIVEGPFDAIKMHGHYAIPDDTSISATCTFGTSVTVAQCALLRQLSREFDETFVLFDKGADGPAEELATWTGARVGNLPWSVKDPGVLTEYDLDYACSASFKGNFNNPYWNNPHIISKRPFVP